MSHVPTPRASGAPTARCGPLPLFLAAALAAVPATAELAVTFEDIALEVGFQHRSHGRALVAADWNDDGWVDFYVGNPALPAVADDESFIVWNQGPDAEGNFRFTRGQVLFEQQVAFTASAADIDNDGDQDLFVGIGGQEGIGLDYLFKNEGGVFVDVSRQAGATFTQRSR